MLFERGTGRFKINLFPLAAAFAATLAAQQTPAPALKVVVLEGNGAINNIRLHRAKDPVVQVMDDQDRPIPDATVTLTLPATGPSGAFLDGAKTLVVHTDKEGKAYGRGLQPNGVAGQFQIAVTASYQGQVAQAAIPQTNAGPAVGHSSTKKFAILAIIGGAAAGGAFAARGHGTRPAAATTPGTVIVAGDPSLGGR
jgi:hypothetical protein